MRIHNIPKMVNNRRFGPLARMVQLLGGVLLLGSIAVACGAEEQEAVTMTCAYQGQDYGDGVLFPAGDGCNQCMCNPNGDTPGAVECSGIDCSGLNEIVCDSGPLGEDGDKGVTCIGLADEAWQCDCWSVEDGIVGSCESEIVTSSETNPCTVPNCCGFESPL